MIPFQTPGLPRQVIASNCSHPAVPNRCPHGIHDHSRIPCCWLEAIAGDSALDRRVRSTCLGANGGGTGVDGRNLSRLKGEDLHRDGSILSAETSQKVTASDVRMPRARMLSVRSLPTDSSAAARMLHGRQVAGGTFWGPGLDSAALLLYGSGSCWGAAPNSATVRSQFQWRLDQSLWTDLPYHRQVNVATTLKSDLSGRAGSDSPDLPSWSTPKKLPN